MKILHLADLHLGKSVSGLPMIDSQKHVLNEAIKLCKKENINHIIISGDVYDRSIPPEDAVELLNDFLSTAVLDEHIKVYMISGNHDSKERLACFNGILEKQGLFIDDCLKDNLQMNKHEIYDDELAINIYSLPYTSPGEIRCSSEDNTIKDFQSAVSKVLDENQLNENEINILNTHYFVIGSEPPLRSDSESRLVVGTLEQISYRIFDNFDYVALGHLHCPQSIGRETIRYAGSPLKYSVDEIQQHKSFSVINIKSKGNITIEEFEINPLHEFVFLEGTVDELTEHSEIKDDRIVFFKLTDNEPVINAANRLKIKYPYYVGLKYINNAEDSEVDELDLEKAEGFESLTIEEQFNNFFHYVNERDLNEIQEETVKKCVRELQGEDD